MCALESQCDPNKTTDSKKTRHAARFSQEKKQDKRHALRVRRRSWAAATAAQDPRAAGGYFDSKLRPVRWPRGGGRTGTCAPAPPLGPTPPASSRPRSAAAAGRAGPTCPPCSRTGAGATGGARRAHAAGNRNARARQPASHEPPGGRSDGESGLLLGSAGSPPIRCPPGRGRGGGLAA